MKRMSASDSHVKTRTRRHHGYPLTFHGRFILVNCFADALLAISFNIRYNPFYHDPWLRISSFDGFRWQAYHQADQSRQSVLNLDCVPIIYLLFLSLNLTRFPLSEIHLAKAQCLDLSPRPFKFTCHGFLSCAIFGIEFELYVLNCIIACSAAPSGLFPQSHPVAASTIND